MVLLKERTPEVATVKPGNEAARQELLLAVQLIRSVALLFNLSRIPNLVCAIREPGFFVEHCENHGQEWVQDSWATAIAGVRTGRVGPPIVGHVPRNPDRVDQHAGLHSW